MSVDPGRGKKTTALLILLAVLALGLAAVLLRHSGDGPAGIPPTPELLRKGAAADKVAAARRELVRELLAALRSAAESSNRADLSKASADLVREGPAAVPQLLEALAKERSWNYRTALLSVLSRIPDLAAVAGLESFYLGLKPDELAAKIETARALGRSGNRPVREALLRLLARETDPKAREEISQILLAAGLRPEELDGADSKEKDLLQKEAQAKEGQRSRIEALDRLDPKSDASLPELRKTALSEGTIGIATLSFRKLEARGDASAVQILAERVRAKPETPSDKIIQTNALSSLCRMKAIPARTTVREFVLSEDPDLRRQAITLVGAFGDEAMLPLLEQASRSDASPETRRLVEEATLGIRSRSATKPASPKEGS